MEGLQYNPEEAIGVLSRSDNVMAELINRAGPFRLEMRSMKSPFESLLQSIVYQQLSGKAAATILHRVLALFPKGQVSPEVLLQLADADLRAAGLSRAKLAAARDLAVKTTEGLVPTAEHLYAMTDEEVITRLTAVRGIGRWTAEMLLIFYLGRPDVLPVSDLGVRKGYRLVYKQEELPLPNALLSYGERWRPYRSVASWYLWRALDAAATLEGEAGSQIS